MPDSSNKTTFDAVLAPAQYPHGKVEIARLLALKAEFGPILGCKRVHSRYAGGGKALVTASPQDHLCYNADHPEAGQEKYEWQDRGDGVCYGLLKPEAVPVTPEDEAKAKSAASADRKTTVLARRDELSAIDQKDRTPDQHVELAKLERFIPIMFPEESAPPQAKPVQASVSTNPTPAKV